MKKGKLLVNSGAMLTLCTWEVGPTYGSYHRTCS